MVYCRLVVKEAALKGEIAVFREGGLSGAEVGLAGGGKARGCRYCNALTVNKVAL